MNTNARFIRRSLTAAGLMLAALTFTACSPTSGSTSSGSGSSSPACTHWANVRDDVRAGILTDAELRAKVSEVRSSTTSATVESAATELLAGITSHNKSKLTSGYLALNSACG